MNPELAIENRPGQMGLNLPPLEGGLRDVFEKPLAVLGAVATLAGGIGASANALINPSKADAAISCPNSNANKLPGFTSPDFSQPNVTGMEVQIVPRSLGDGTVDYTCAGESQSSIVTFDVQQNGTDSSAFALDLISSTEAGISIQKVQETRNNFAILTCHEALYNANHMVCEVPGLSQKEKTSIFVQFKSSKVASSQSITAKVDPVVFNDMQPVNNDSLVSFNVSGFAVAGNVPGTVVYRDASGRPIDPYKVSILNKESKKIGKSKNCWQTPVLITPTFPDDARLTTNLVVDYTNNSLPRIKTGRVNISQLLASGSKIIIKSCTNNKVFKSTDISINKKNILPEGPTEILNAENINLTFSNKKIKLGKKRILKPILRVAKISNQTIRWPAK